MRVSLSLPHTHSDVLTVAHCFSQPHFLANRAILQYRAGIKYNGEDRMPTVLRVGRFRFYFFSNEGQEPAHIQAAGDQAKFWLEPIHLAANYGFPARDLNEIERLIREHHDELLEAWNEYFS